MMMMMMMMRKNEMDIDDDSEHLRRWNTRRSHKVWSAASHNNTYKSGDDDNRRKNPKKKQLTCSSFHLEGLVGSCQIGTLAAPPWASSVLFFRTHKKTQFLGHFLCTTSTNTNHFRWGGSAKQTQNCKVTKIDFGLLCFKICVFHRPELGASSSASPQKDPEL